MYSTVPLSWLSEDFNGMRTGRGGRSLSEASQYYLCPSFFLRLITLPHPASFKIREQTVYCVWNVMAHAQKPYLVFWRNGRIYLNRRGRQFSRLLVAEVCASAVVMLDVPCSEVVWRVLTTHLIRQFPFTFPIVRHSVPSHFNWTLPTVPWVSRSWCVFLKSVLVHNVITDSASVKFVGCNLKRS
jgi:hypothetical protein